MIISILTGNPFFASCLAATVLMLVWSRLQPASGIRWPQAVFPPLWAFCTTFALGFAVVLTPVTLDRFLYAADGGYGFQASFAGARLLLRNPWLLHTCAVCYFNLPIGMTLLYLELQRRDHTQASRFVRFAAWLGITGWVLYFACPGVGPGGTFPNDFPNHIPKAAVIPVAIGMEARNAMPSLHTAWILCMLWSAPPLNRWWRAALWAFSGFTLLYALSAGGHYLVDLVVAAPFARAVWVGIDRQWKSPLLLHNAAMVALWLILLRFANGLLSGNAIVIYGLTAATLVGALPVGWKKPLLPAQQVETATAGAPIALDA